MAGKLEKTCSRCKETKVLALFNKHPHAKGRRRPECAECTKKYHRERRRTKPERYQDRKYALKKNFGMSLDDYLTMVAKQGGKCAICGVTEESLSRFLCVDHCHQTEKVRGLLCTYCNSGLGFFRDKPELLASAIQYLTFYREG